MQMNENKSIEARTFPEIWNALDGQRRDSLRFALMTGLRVSPQTVWNWRTGRRRPDYLHRKEIARIATAVTGSKCHPDLLFP